MDVGSWKLEVGMNLRGNFFTLLFMVSRVSESSAGPTSIVDFIDVIDKEQVSVLNKN